MLPETHFFDNISLSMLKDPDAASGEYKIQLYYYQKYDTGKTKLVTTLQGNTATTEDVPTMTDILVAYGECTVVK